MFPTLLLGSNRKHFYKISWCEIQDIEYNEKPQVFLKLTDENIIIFVDFKKLLPGKFNPSYINMEIGDRISIEADIFKWKNNEPDWMLYMSWGKNEDTKESNYEKVVEEIVNLLEPICIGSN